MTTIVSFSQNISLVLALTFLYSFIYPRLRQMETHRQQVLNGALFGAFAVVSILQAQQVAPGVRFDGRTVVICIAGLFCGPVAAIIAAAMATLFGLSLGGVGAASGIGSAITAVLLSTGISSYLRRSGKTPDAVLLLEMGFALALLSLFWTMTVPAFGPRVVTLILPVAVIIYPVATLLLGTLLNNQQRTTQMEAAKRDNERRFRAIFDNSSQLIALIRPDGTLLEANRTALEFGGLRLDDVVNRPIWETHWWLIAPETQAQLKQAVERAAQGESVQYEVDVWDAQKHPTTIEFSIRPIRDESGRVVLLMPEGRDISVRKQLEQRQLDLTLERERGRLLKKFISDVSHDLRTPLSVMRLNLEVLLRAPDPAKHQRRVEVLIAQEQHLTRLLTDMMAMLSLDNADHEFNFGPADANALGKSMFETYEAAARRKGQAFTLALHETPLPIQADQVELGQALGKLISNALSYTHADGTVTLTTRPENDTAVFEIRDSGIGIAPEDLPHIFERFYRADNARPLDSGGSGLGLPIAKKIVEAHRGRIEVESQVDAGSTFRVILPLCAPEAEASRISPEIRA